MKGSQKLDKRDIWCLAGLFAGVIAFLLVFSTATSPLAPQWYGWDSAFFLLMGKMLRAGKLPYVDIFDMKGPIIFFLEALGQSIASGRTGAFCLQILFDFATAALLFLSARLFLSRGRSLFAVALSFVFFSITIFHGNMTEEYCLTPVALCLYLALRFLIQAPEAGSRPHPPACAFVYGLCSAYIIWIKVTHGALIFSIVLYFVCSLLWEKRFKALLCNALAYVAGLAVVTVPVLVWFARHGALYDLVYGTFIVPFFYASGGMAGRSLWDWFNILKDVSPILIVLGLILVLGLYRQRLGRMLLCCGFFSLLALLPGEAYAHYYTMAVPFVILGVVLVFRSFGQTPGKILGILIKAGAVVYVVVLVGAAVFFGAQSLSAALDPAVEAEARDYARQGAMIPPEEQDSVLAYAGNIAPRWYMTSGLMPCYRHCAYVYIELAQEMVEEYARMLEESPPKWFAVSDGLSPNGSPLDQIVLAALEEKYDLAAGPDGGSVALYRLKG